MIRYCLEQRLIELKNCSDEFEKEKRSLDAAKVRIPSQVQTKNLKIIFQVYQISAVYKSHETICEKWDEELAKNIAILDSDLKAFIEKMKSENGKPFNEMSNGIQA